MEKAEIKLRDLYPGLSEEEVNEVEFNMMRYLEVVLKINERLAAERKQPKDGHPLS